MSTTAPARRMAASIFLLSTLVCLPQLGQHMFWPNEADMVVSANGSLADVFDMKWKNQSPGWPLVLNLWMRIGGGSEFWARLLSVLLGSLGTVWCFRLGERLGGRRAGIAAAVVFALIPTAHWHMREARMYGLLTALTVGALAAQVAWEQDGRRRDLVAMVVVLLAAAYTHFFGVAVAVAVLGSLLVGAVLRGGDRLVVRLRAPLGAMAATLLGLLPQLARLGAGVDYAGSPSSRSLDGGLWSGLVDMGKQVWLPMAKAPKTFFDVSPTLLLVSLGLLVLGAVLIEQRREGDVPAWWSGATLVLLAFGVILGFVAIAEGHDIRARYASFIAGPLAVGIGLALTQPRGPLKGAVYLLAVGLLWASGTSIYAQHTYSRGNLDLLADHLEVAASPDDTVVPEPGILANVIRLKTGRTLTRREALFKDVEAGIPPSDTTWVLHVHGSAGRPEIGYLKREFRLLEQRTSPGASLYRWSRSAREADREADVVRLERKARAARKAGRSNAILTGVWRAEKTGVAPLSRRLDKASDVLVARGRRGRSGAPDVSLRPGDLTVVARGKGWKMFATPRAVPSTLERAPLLFAVIDLAKWTGKGLPKLARQAIARLSLQGSLIVRLIPPTGEEASNPLALARWAINAGARVVSVDGLGTDAFRPHKNGLILPGLGDFSGTKGSGLSGRAALISVGRRGRIDATVWGTSTGEDGLPRAEGNGAHRLSTVRRPRSEGPAPKAGTFDEGRAGAGASLLDRYPDKARAVVETSAGAERPCLPLAGRTQQYHQEWGEGGVGGLEQRLWCGEDQYSEQWNATGIATHRFGGDVHECLYLHPLGDQPATLSFRDVPLGALLQGGFGVSDAGVSKAKGLVNLLVRVDGKPVFEGSVGRKKGWFPWAANTARFARGTHDVDFVVTAKNRRWRHFCFDAEVLP
jgi:hypothetical protein